MRKRLHPNIVSLLDTQVQRINNPQQRHVLYMLMPLYTEGSLWDVVHRRGRHLSNSEILSVISQVMPAPCSTSLCPASAPPFPGTATST